MVRGLYFERIIGSMGFCSRLNLGDYLSCVLIRIERLHIYIDDCSLGWKSFGESVLLFWLMFVAD
jgi:hypothetical protein